MASDPVRIAVVIIAILALIVLITKFRIHPFIALILASWFLGIACGLPPTEVIKHFEKGFGDVLSFVGIVIGLGAMLGGILISSGGADVLANDLIALGGKKWIPWTMFVASLLIGLPLFFEVGFVLLVPLAFVISKRMDTPILRVGLPMLAGLSVAHALVPPHPAPTLAVATFHADAGKTILYAILVGIPTGILAGPIFANFAAGWVHSGSAAGALFPGPESTEEETKRTQARPTAAPGPTLAAVLTTILLPPVLMMSRSLADAFLPGTELFERVDRFCGRSDRGSFDCSLFWNVRSGIEAGTLHGSSRRDPEQELGCDRGRGVNRRSGWGVQRDADCHQNQRAHRPMGDSGAYFSALSGLGSRRSGQNRDRLSHRSHDYRCGNNGTDRDWQSSRQQGANGSGGRFWIHHLIPRERRRFLVGQGVLPTEPPRHLQILDPDGNSFVGSGPHLRASAESRCSLKRGCPLR